MLFKMFLIGVMAVPLGLSLEETSKSGVCYSERTYRGGVVNTRCLRNGFVCRVRTARFKPFQRMAANSRARRTARQCARQCNTSCNTCTTTTTVTSTPVVYEQVTVTQAPVVDTVVEKQVETPKAEEDTLAKQLLEKYEAGTTFTLTAGGELVPEEGAVLKEQPQEEPATAEVTTAQAIPTVEAATVRTFYRPVYQRPRCRNCRLR